MTDPLLDELRGLLPRCMTRDWVRLGGRLVRLLKDRNHVDRHQPVLARLLEQARESAALREQRRLLEEERSPVPAAKRAAAPTGRPLH